jgi:LacI family transcriptional regulator
MNVAVTGRSYADTYETTACNSMTRPSGHRATVRDIAAQTGVSIATVSRVLNDRNHVAPHTRDLVQRAMKQLGVHAPGPRTATNRPAQAPVYLRCPYLLTDYFGLIVSSIAETLDLHGRELLLNAGEATQPAARLSTLASRLNIGGAIFVLPPEPGEQLVALRARRFPFVVVDPRTPMPRDIAAVSAAHFAGARSVTRHLVELGHRRIGVIAGPQNWLASDARLAGHASALAEVGVLPDPALVRPTEPTALRGHAAAGELLDRPRRPTALIGFNDKAAVGAMAAAAERGLRIPDDLSIAGFDDIDLAQATSPMLTTVRQPVQEMGRIAVSLLIRLLERQRLDALHIELATELIVRGSTGSVPSE